MDKKAKKRIDKKCTFCDVAQYELLDLHRIKPGSQGGKYRPGNTVTVCPLHHRMIHAGNIIVKEKRFSTGGYVVICEIDGQERLFRC